MQDYNINVNYNNVSTETRQTSPNYHKTQIPRKTQIKGAEEKHTQSTMSFHKTVAVGLAVATKVNQYVGELTENTVTQRKRQVGIAFTGMAALMVKDPIMGMVAMATYIGNAAIQYNITAYKENLTADFMKSLSGGVYNTRK